MAIGVVPPKTDMRLGQQTVVRLYPSAVKEFGSVIAKAGSQDACAPVTPEKLEDDLAAWLNDIRLDDGEHDSKLLGLHPIINTNHVALYRCSWCGNPSAVLRKCASHPSSIIILCAPLIAIIHLGSGCTKTRYGNNVPARDVVHCSCRYCDAGCQRSHWKDHKKFCNVEST